MLYFAGLRYLLFSFFPIWLGCAGPLAAQQHAGSFAQADVENGFRLYGAHCSACHGADGDLAAGVDLRRGNFRRGSTDESLAGTITGGIAGTAMPPTKFSPYELAAIIAYLRSMRDFKAGRVELGDAGRGRRLFESSCLACHRVNGAGARAAPDLSDIGAIRPADAIQRAVLDPNAAPRAQSRFIRAVTRDGRVVTGRRLNEDTFTVQLIDDRGRLASIDKRGLREYSASKTPPAPFHKDKFSPAQIADLVAYLASLKGSN